MRAHEMKGIEVYDIGKFRLRDDLAVPEPGPGQVRVRVLAAGICGTDVHICKGDPSMSGMLELPVILGHEFCGVVDLCGPGVAGPEPGTYVSAEMHEFCGACAACRARQFHACQNTRIHGLSLDGCFAEFVVLSAKNLVTLPESLPVRAAAILDPLGNAVHSALKVPVDGLSVAVIGHGPIGAMAAKVAVFAGAARVWVTDVNAKAVERGRDWVAKSGLEERVVVLDTAGDAHAASIARLVSETKGGVDVVLEFSGHPTGINDALRVVRAAGDVILLGLPKQEDVTLEDFGKNVIFKGITMHAVIGREIFGTWAKMLELHERGFDIAELVSAEYPLEDFERALARFASGEEQKVVLYPSDAQNGR